MGFPSRGSFALVQNQFLGEALRSQIEEPQKTLVHIYRSKRRKTPRSHYTVAPPNFLQRNCPF